MKSNAEPKIDELQYEQAFALLETAVKSLESGDVTVKEALEKFEQGMNAAKQCMELLDNAENKMNLLIKASTGKIVFDRLSIAEDK